MAEADAQTSDEAAAIANEGNGESQGPVLIKDRFLVHADQAIPELDSPTAKAYMAEDRRDLSRPVFALICNPGLPTRMGAMLGLRGAGIKGLVGIIEWDVSFWGPIGQRTMIIILERPKGGRVMGHSAFRINEYDLPRRVIEPLASALGEMSSIGISHRAIRPDNIFFMDEECQTIAFGECYTSPPGYDQPITYEPTERAMASPAGRGVGNSRDDVYAFGATLVSLIIDKEPITGISDEELLREKTDNGSYATITGANRIPLSLLEPLRGMLSDDPDQRWGPDEIDMWISGRKMTPQQKRLGKRASTPFAFAGKDYYSARMLARAFTMNTAEAARSMRDAAFETWLRRYLEDPNLANAIKNLLETAQAQAGTFMASDDVLVTRVSILMDPVGPIRYKGFTFMPDGFGAAFAMELLRSGSPQVPAEILTRDIADLWYQTQEAYAPDASIQQKNFSQLKLLLNNTDPGFGAERALYECNNSLPCQSPLLVQEYVLDMEHLLPALDRTANNMDLSHRPMDRHIAAFVASRFKEDIAPHLRALGASGDDTQTVGMLSLLAFIQWKLKQHQLYGLASWVGGHLGPAINSYHSRDTRSELEREVPRLVRRGSLPEMFDLIDNSERRREDTEGFEDAKAEFAAAELEIQDIEGKGEEQLTKAERTGQQAAAMSAIMLSFMIMTVILMVELF